MRALLFCILMFAASLAMPAQASTFQFSNAKGPYGVGLRIVRHYDLARAYKGKTDLLTGLPTQGERARPIQTLIWYPATGAGTPVRYRAYVESAATETAFDLAPAQVSASAQGWIAKRWAGLSADRIRQELDRPMWAVRDVAPAPGKFPVVVYAPSFSASAHENADLCEFLASQGYVVLSSASLGAHSRDMTHDLEGVEAQVSDIEYLIGYARSLAQADTGPVAVLGYSWGGMANLFAAARDSRIGAVISLDGSVRYFPTLVSSAKYVTPERMTAPFLFLAARPRSMEDLIASGQDMSASLINQLRYGDVYQATLSPMTHANFSSEYQRFALDDGWGFGEYSRDETSLGFSWTARYVARFLDAYLKADAGALAFLGKDPVANGAPAHMLSMNVRRSTLPPPTIETLATELGKQGFDHAEQAYAALRATDPGFKLDEGDLRHWGYQLLWADRNREAIGIFRLVTTLFPTSGNAFDCLGEAYQQNGDYDRAIASYRTSLALDPSNSNAVQHLEALKSLKRG